MMAVVMMSGEADGKAGSTTRVAVVAWAVVIAIITAGHGRPVITRPVTTASEGVEAMPVVMPMRPVVPVRAAPRGCRRCESQADGREDCGNCKSMCRFHS